MSKVFNGLEVAKGIISELRQKPTPKKFLAVFLVGENAASESFVKQKEKTAKELGIDFRVYRFQEETTNDKLRKEVSKIALAKKCGGVVVQLPLPSRLNRHYILNVIPREKDVDVLGERALGAFYTGRNPVLPPAVGVVKKILTTYNLQLITMRVAVVGCGFLVGKPIATWLIGQAREIYVLDEGSDLFLLKQADLVISGVGRAGLIKPEMLKDGASVIDFGYDANVNGGVIGDFDVSNLQPTTDNLKFYTPTPGGTGPILVAQLMENFYILNS